MSDDVNPHLWILGVALAMTGSVMSTGGVNIQKFTFKRAQSVGGAAVSYWRQPLWCLGLAMVVGGSLGDFLALGFAAQSIVAPVGSSTLVANIVFARIWLKEALSRKDIAGTALILTGSIVAVIFGNHSEPTYTLEELVALYEGVLFLVYISFCIVAVVALSVVVFRCEALLRGITQRQNEIDHDKRRHSDAIARLHLQMVELDSAYAPYVKWHPFSLCTLSGMLGAQSIMFAKCMAVLLRRTFEGDNQFGKPLTYVFLLACACTISGQIHFLAKALQRFDALYVVPVFQCAFIGVSTLGGVCFFKEFASFSVIQSLMFPFGLIMTLGGVYLLSQRTMASSGHHDRMLEMVPRPGFSHRSWVETQKSVEEFNDEMDHMAPLVPLLGAAWRLRQSLTQDELLGATVNSCTWAELSSKADSRREEDESRKDEPIAAI